MTTDEAIARIPAGYLLRLYQWRDSDEDTGWGASLMDTDGNEVFGDEATPAAAIMDALAELPP